MSNFLAAVPLVGKLFDLIDQAVPDKDKRAELRQAALEVTTDFQKTLVSTATVPWVDGAVKLIYALVALAAPLGSAAMSAFGLYAYAKGIELGDPATHAGVTSAFGVWRGLRHLEKKAGVATPSPAPLPRYDLRPR